MYKLRYSGKMKKDLKNCQKRNLDISLLENLIEKLLIPEPLEAKNKEHNLPGNYFGFRECHVSSDWREYLELARTGTHSDLFKK